MWDLDSHLDTQQTVKVYSTQSWSCIASVSSEKRVFAIAISDNGAGVVELARNDIIELQCFCKNFFSKSMDTLVTHVHLQGVLIMRFLARETKSEHGIWDARNLSTFYVLKGNVKAITSIYFTSDGVFTATVEDLDYVHVYNVMEDFESDIFGHISSHIHNRFTL